MRVRVYYNLTKKCFSVMDKKTRLVIAHARKVELSDVSFKVSESGRQRVIKERRKNVHAFVEGNWEQNGVSLLGVEIAYNPYLYSSFVVKDTLQPIHRADSAYLYNKSIYI